MSNWDARWRLAALAIAIALTACLQSLIAAGIALAFSLLLLIAGGLLSKRSLSRLALVAISLIPFLIVLPFLDGGTTQAITVSLRALAISTFAILLVAAPFDRLLAAAHSLGVPGPLTQIARLVHRYSFTLIDELRRLRTAWRCRGFRVRTSAHCYRTYAYGVGAVLVRSAERGERVGDAMKARGFDGTFKLAVPFHAKPLDAVYFLAITLPVLALLLWDRLT